MQETTTIINHRTWGSTPSHYKILVSIHKQPLLAIHTLHLLTHMHTQHSHTHAHTVVFVPTTLQHWIAILSHTLHTSHFSKEIAQLIKHWLIDNHRGSKNGFTHQYDVIKSYKQNPFILHITDHCYILMSYNLFLCNGRDFTAVAQPRNHHRGFLLWSEWNTKFKMACIT